MEQLLQLLDDYLIFHRDYAGSGLPGHDFTREIGARQHADRMPREHFFDNLGHPLVGRQLQPLGQADHRDPRPQVRLGLFQYGAKIVRGDSHDQHVGPGHRFAYLGCRGKGLRQFYVRQIFAIAMMVIDIADRLLVPRPKLYGRIARNQRCHCGSPRPPAQQSDFQFHRCPFLDDSSSGSQSCLN